MSHLSLLNGPRACSMTVFFVLLIVFGVLVAVESRASSPTTASHRKPPFNGSIFGKRSGSPPRGPTSPGMLMELEEGGFITRTESPVEALALMLKQDENLIRAAFNHCLTQQKSSLGKCLMNEFSLWDNPRALQRQSNFLISSRFQEFDSIASELCAALIIGSQPGRRGLDGGNWFNRLQASAN